MRDFVNATFGSVELDIISQTLEEWRASIGIDRTVENASCKTWVQKSNFYWGFRDGRRPQSAPSGHWSPIRKAGRAMRIYPTAS